MKATVDSRTLERALKAVFTAVPSRLSVDIFGCFVLSTEGTGSLTIKATDGSMLILTSVFAEDEVPGSAAIPAKFLLDQSKALPQGPVTIESTDSNTAVLSWASGSAELPNEDASLFPNVSTPSAESPSFTMPTGTLRAFLDKALPFVLNMDDNRSGGIGSVYFDTAGDCLSLAACDRMVLSEITAPGVSTSGIKPFLLHRRHCAALKAVLDVSDQDLTVQTDSRMAVFRFGSTTALFPLVVANYPNYKQIFPASTALTFLADREKLLETVRRVGVCSEKDIKGDARQLTFNFDRSLTTLEASDRHYSLHGKDTIEAEWSGDAFEVTFRLSSVTTLLEAIPSKKVEIRLNDPRKAAIFLPYYDEDEHCPSNQIRCMAMPVLKVS